MSRAYVNSTVTTLGVTVVAVALLAGAVQLQALRERAFPPPPVDEDAVYIQSGPAIRRMSGAYAGLAADVYWIRALQYFGGIKRRLIQRPLGPEPPPALAAPPAEFAGLYPLLDITTTLDPMFNIAYRFGAVFLAEPYPSGPGRPDLAVVLLEKGLRARPDKWEYMQDIGFVHYWYSHDYRAAAGWFDKASQAPGAPWWLRSLAATTLAQGGDRESSRTIWQAIQQSADNDWLRKDAERRLAQLRALDEIEFLGRQVETFRARAGVSPTGWTDVVRAGLLGGIPADPARTPYELTDDGRVRLSRSSPLWPLPPEPRRIVAPPAP
jgi:hypothetical protein